MIIEPGPAIVDANVLVEVEASLDGIMPVEYKHFLLTVNGGMLKGPWWLREAPTQVAHRFSLERFFSVGADSEWSDLVKQHRQFRALYPNLTDWACIADTPGGDFVLIDSAGRVAFGTAVGPRRPGIRGLRACVRAGNPRTCRKPSD